eukprot:198950-Ditylum_brightwellii.AAC.1
MAVEDLYKTLKDIESSLEVFPEVLSEEYFNTYDEFPAPLVILTYSTSYRYTEQTMSNVLTIINENEKKFITPPQNMWNRGPPKSNKQRE